VNGAPLRIHRLVGETLRLTGAAFGRLVPVAFVPALLSAALAGTGEPAPLGEVTAGMLWSGVVDLVLGTLVTGVLCLGALDIQLGKHHGIDQYIRQAARHFLPLLVFGIVLSIAMAIGLVFLILPGLYVAARYLPYVPATVFEDRGWQGTNRAEELTRGYRWPLVGALLVFGILLAAFFVAVGLPLAYAAEGFGALFAILASAALTAIGYVVFATFSTVVYLRLRELREGAKPADVAREVD
jgi:hypothetical protein